MSQGFKYLFEGLSSFKGYSDGYINISEEEVLLREKLAFNKGYDEAKQKQHEVQSSSQEEINTKTYLILLENINDKSSHIANQIGQSIEKNLCDLAISIGNKLADIAIKESYLEIVKNFISKITSEMNQEILLTIKVNSKLVQKLEKDLDSAKYLVMENNDLNDSDCIIEWENGKMESILSQRRDELNTILVNIA